MSNVTPFPGCHVPLTKPVPPLSATAHAALKEAKGSHPLAEHLLTTALREIADHATALGIYESGEPF